MLQGGISIVAKVFHNLPQIHEQGRRSFWQHLKSPLLLIPCNLCQGWLSNFTQNTKCRVPYQRGKWDAVLQGESYIAAEVFHNIAQMHEKDLGSFWKHLWTPYSSNRVISAVVDSQIAHIIPDLGWHVCLVNGMLCCKDSCQLLSMWSKSFIWCIR